MGTNYSNEPVLRMWHVDPVDWVMQAGGEIRRLREALSQVYAISEAALKYGTSSRLQFTEIMDIAKDALPEDSKRPGQDSRLPYELR